MASLPPERTTISRPFTNCGADFAGPFSLRRFRGRYSKITKGYACIFVCFATRAIHVEAVNDLSTAAFLAAFARFVSRRGCPSRVYSDNGTNFQGASGELKKEARKFVEQSRLDIVAAYGLQDLSWHFIPASALHMGGLWEAVVRIFKQHFRRITGSITYTFKEFSTVLASIEACMNSRPPSAASSDLTALTPGHFLVGGPILAPAETQVSPNSISHLNRWQRVKAVAQDFCRR